MHPACIKKGMWVIAGDLTDDGRIKPDVVAKGVGVYSPTAGSNSSYYRGWNKFFSSYDCRFCSFTS